MSDTNDNTNIPNNNGNSSTNSWAMWQRLVLSEITRLDNANKDLVKKIQDLEVKLAVLQTKAAAYGAIAGLVAGAVLEFIVYFLVGQTSGKH